MIDIREYLELKSNTNRSPDLSNVVTFRWKFIFITAYIRKEEWLKINDQTVHHKN
jgi:hypothetical protein